MAQLPHKDVMHGSHAFFTGFSGMCPGRNAVCKVLYDGLNDALLNEDMPFGRGVLLIKNVIPLQSWTIQED